MQKDTSKHTIQGIIRQFFYLLILVLVVLAFWQLGDVFKSSTVQEYGMFETMQSVVLLLIAVSFSCQAIRRSSCRPILLSLGLLALAALVREQDAYFDKLIPSIGWTWCWSFPIAGMILLLRHRRTIGGVLLHFFHTNAFHMMVTAVVIIIPIAQCLGHRSFLADLMGDTQLDSHLMRRILEEPIELLGYIQILLASVECLFEQKAALAEEERP